MPRATGRRQQVKDWLAYVALRVVAMTLHSWPVEVSLATARLLGDGLYYVDARHRKRALHNLRRSLPELPDAEHRRLARASMRNLFELGVEVLWTTRLVRLDTFGKFVRLEHFRESLDLMFRSQKGLILLTGHYGNWEVLGYVLATLGFETTSVARPLDNPHINRWLLGVRERQGQRIIDKKGATEEVTAILDRGGMVGFIADQNAGPKGVFVDFFGRKASTYKSIGLLAMQYDVPIVVGYARRTPKAFVFDVGVQDVIRPADWKDQPDPLRYVTQRYTAALEQVVRGEPGQYLWAHRRWKTRPKGEQPEAYD